MDLFYTFMAYFPFCSVILGIVSLIIYFILKRQKKIKYTALLIIACIGIGLFVLYHCALIFAMYLGWFPIPN